MSNRNIKGQDRIIFFDGVCNLCNASVDIVIRKDKRQIYKYASLQSDYAKNLFPNYGLNPTDMDSIVLFDQGKIYYKSTAALKIAGKMSGIYPLLGLFWIVPSFIIDGVYNWVARNRYTWFGKKDSCRVPTDEERALFLT